MPPRPGCCSRRASGESETGSTRSSTGSRPTAPWGLEIDPLHRVPGYEGDTTFHPIFLYELIYNLSMVGVLLLIDWRFRIRAPALFALYVSLYTFGRFFEELLRIDPSHEFGGLRLNAWVSLVVFVCSTAFFVWWQFFDGTLAAATAEWARRPQGPTDVDPQGPVTVLRLWLRVRPAR